ncbi:hypothetical protein [Desulfosporosinus hippei]|uniref:hypothetical protein n=1 Tax=Desulfosporosinus hippei TaxID=569859 RepID=UPI0015A03D94|nr:hypothetical protein [Desulfosporosinus hippei]
MPIQIMGLWRILTTTNWWVSAVISIGVSLLLAFQADASQTAGFIIPTAIILLSNTNNNFFPYSVLGVFSLMRKITLSF